MRLEGKVAIITGAGSGIGKATAERFVAEGARVAIVGRTAERLEAVAAGLGDAALAIAADVSQPAQAAGLVAQVLARWGRLDILVNNHAALHRPVRVHEIRDEEWDYILANNLRGYFLTAKAALPVMMEQRSGAIIMIGSETVQSVTLFVGAYGAAKGGVLALTKAIAAEYAEFGIRCNCVQSGATGGTQGTRPLVEAGVDISPLRNSRKKPIPLGHLGRPEDHASAILFLASDEAAWITGAVLNVDGGYTVI